MNYTLYDFETKNRIERDRLISILSLPSFFSLKGHPFLPAPVA